MNPDLSPSLQPVELPVPTSLVGQAVIVTGAEKGLGTRRANEI